MILPKPYSLTLNVSFTIVALFALLLIDASFIFEVEAGGNTEIVKEDHELENYQVILLFISGAVYLQTLFYAQKGQKLFPAAGALLCFSFILRELDVEKFDLPEIIILLGHGIGRNILLIGLWLLLAVLFVRNSKHYLGIAVNLLMTRSALLMVAGGALADPWRPVRRQDFRSNVSSALRRAFGAEWILFYSPCCARPFFGLAA